MPVEGNVPKPGAVERVAGTVALVTGVPLAIWVAGTFVANAIDGEILEVPTLLAALPAELPDLGLFTLAFRVWHSERSKRLGMSPEEHNAHPASHIIRAVEPHIASHRARRRAAR